MFLNLVSSNAITTSFSDTIYESFFTDSSKKEFNNDILTKKNIQLQDNLLQYFITKVEESNTQLECSILLSHVSLIPNSYKFLLTDCVSFKNSICYIKQLVYFIPFKKFILLQNFRL